MRRNYILAIALSASFFVLGTTLRLGAEGDEQESINADLVRQAKPESPAPWPHVDPNDPNVERLRADDPTKEIWRQRVQPSGQPGPQSLGRYALQLEPVGIKTFFQQPVAKTPADLKAGNVDVAIFGAPCSALPHSAGSVWAPAEIRYSRDYGGYGAPGFPLAWIEYETLINPFAKLKIVDYGDSGYTPYSQARTLEEIRKVTREILETGAIPFAVGGDHAVPNATYRAIADVFGKKKVAFVHFDVHLDRGKGKLGAFYHGGSYMTLAVKEGLLDGKHVVQFGMGSPCFGAELYDEIEKEGGTVFHLHQIKRDGVAKTFERMYKVLEGLDLVYVSFDVDVFDMSYAPGTGSSEPTGVTPNDLFPELRKFAATKRIVGFDIVEYNPFYDNRGQQTARLVRRVMLQFLTGIAMKKEGMDPNYIHPRVIKTGG
ncbi:MAG: arginase family protein [Planctomycetota bacterium]